jgi:hypothetical protein
MYWRLIWSAVTPCSLVYAVSDKRIYYLHVLGERVSQTNGMQVPSRPRVKSGFARCACFAYATTNSLHILTSQKIQYSAQQLSWELIWNVYSHSYLGGVWSSGICGGQSGAGAGFLRVLRFPLPFIPPNFPSSQITRGRYNRPVSGRRAEWTQFELHPPLCKLKKIGVKHQYHGRSTGLLRIHCMLVHNASSSECLFLFLHEQPTVSAQFDMIWFCSNASAQLSV